MNDVRGRLSIWNGPRSFWMRNGLVITMSPASPWIRVGLGGRAISSGLFSLIDASGLLLLLLSGDLRDQKDSLNFPVASF